MGLLFHFSIVEIKAVLENFKSEIISDEKNSFLYFCINTSYEFKSSGFFKAL